MARSCIAACDAPCDTPRQDSRLPRTGTGDDAQRPGLGGDRFDLLFVAPRKDVPAQLGAISVAALPGCEGRWHGSDGTPWVFANQERKGVSPEQ
jgi:hypothetical protein